MIVWVLQVELFNTNLMIKNMIIHYSLVMVSSDVYQYVTQIFLLEKKLQYDYDTDSVVCCLVSNKLWINMSKTETMLIGSYHCIGHQYLAVNIAGNSLCHVSVAKYLAL